MKSLATTLTTEYREWARNSDGLYAGNHENPRIVAGHMLDIYRQPVDALHSAYKILRGERQTDRDRAVIALLEQVDRERLKRRWAAKRGAQAR